MKKGICNCLAIYDWEGNIEPSEWYQLAKLFFKSIGVIPDFGACGNSQDTSKLLSYEKLDARSQKANFSTCTYIELFKTKPGYKQLVFGWSVSACITTSGGKTIIFCFDNDLHDFSETFMSELMLAVSGMCKPTYGIAYQREFSKGPQLYAIGMVSGLGYGADGMKEADRIGAWMRERLAENRHTQGMFRDVYDLNLLSRRHIEAIVNGQSFGNWVRQTGNGEISELSNGLYWWSVPYDKKQAIRQVLVDNSLVIAR